MSNFIFIQKNVHIQPIIDQLYDHMEDWYTISGIENIAGDRNPVNFLPITMGVVEHPDDNIKDSELTCHTHFYHKYTEIVKWLHSVNCSHHSRAAFLRLPVGGSNNRHVDDGEYYKSRDRYHLSLQGRYQYTVGEEVHIIEPGTFFWFHNKVPHSAVNVGEVDRITFVFDVPHGPNNPQHHLDLFS